MPVSYLPTYIPEWLAVRVFFRGSIMLPPKGEL
jgi:hypothetical protein